MIRAAAILQGHLSLLVSAFQFIFDRELNILVFKNTSWPLSYRSMPYLCNPGHIVYFEYQTCFNNLEKLTNSPLSSCYLALGAKLLR